MRTITKKLNMTPGGIPLLIRLNQYDSDFSIVFTLYSSDSSWAIESGTTARIRGTKKSGTGYSADATVNVSTSTVTVTGDAQMTAVAGINTFEVVLYDGDLELSSANFVVYVEKAAMDADTITDETVLAEITDFNTQIAAAEDAADRAETAQAAAEAAAEEAQQIVGITVDSAMSSTSTNPVQNKVVNAELSTLKEDLEHNVEKVKTDNYDTTTNLLDFTLDRDLWKQGAPNAAQIYTIYFDKKHPVTQDQVIYGAVKSQAISGFRMLVFAYGPNDDFISKTQLAYNGQTGSYTVPSGIAYIYFGFSTNSTANPITPEQIVSLGNVGYAGSEAVTATDFPDRYVPKVQELSKEVAYYDLTGIRMIVGTIRSVSSDDTVDFYDSTVIDYRICTPGIQQYDFPITFTPKSGYRIYFNTKGAGEETYTGSGWKTAAVTISAGTKWTVTVAKNPDTSSPADLEQFCSAVATDVPFATLKEKIIKIEEEIGKQSDSANHGVNIKYNDRTDALTQLTRMPMFLIFADIHGFGQYLERIGDFHDANCASSCKDVICLGDMVYNEFDDDFTFMSESDFGKNVLLTIGNHDCYDGTTIGGVSQTDMYDKFFGNVSSWGVTQPTDASTDGLMYYYKDYDSDIRLIVLDEYYWDSTELSWFLATLESARTAGLSVIVAQHQGNFTEAEYTPLANYAFGTANYEWIRYTAGYTDRRNAVNSFIGNGGDFIGWINGHTHFEQFGTFELSNGKQFNMTFSNAGQDSTSRIKIPYYSQDCFYYLAIDTTNKWVYVLTIGQASNKWFHRNLMLMYNYQTQEVVKYY